MRWGHDKEARIADKGLPFAAAAAACCRSDSGARNLCRAHIDEDGARVDCLGGHHLLAQLVGQPARLLDRDARVEADEAVGVQQRRLHVVDGAARDGNERREGG